MIGRLHHVVLDCPDPRALARFYSELLGTPVVWDDDDWSVVARDRESSGLAFQRAPDHEPPRWPDPDFPQQFHLDVMVDDVLAADAPVRALGAEFLADKDGRVRIYADPAGHPFCLIRRPGWAQPIRAAAQDPRP